MPFPELTTGPSGMNRYRRCFKACLSTSVHSVCECLALAPVTAVERAVLDRFGDVGNGQLCLAFEVGDGAGDLQDAIVGAGTEALLLHGAFEKLLGIGAEFAEGSNL